MKISVVEETSAVLVTFVARAVNTMFCTVTADCPLAVVVTPETWAAQVR